MRQTHVLIAAVCLAAVACEQPAMPELVASNSPSQSSLGVTDKAQGNGTVDLSTANAGILFYSLHTKQRADGTAEGEFWQYRETAAGTVEFTGRATCLSFDPVNNRAWIAGTIVENRSTNPAFRVDTLHLPGMDIWFRVVDYADAAVAEADRSTVFGFRGSAGIKTSLEYCLTKPWPDTPTRDARTFPVLTGDIKVKTD